MNLYPIALYFHIIGALRRTSIQTRVTTAPGILALMVFKPDLTLSLVKMGLAIALGLVSSLPAWTQRANQSNLA